MISLENFNMMKFIPQSLKESKDVQKLCEVFDWYLKDEIYAKRDQLFLFDLNEETDDSILDEMAYQEHVDYYDSSLSKAQKAEMVKKSFETHLTKGTKYAVESALLTVFSDFTLTEWFEYGGEPYHFRVIQNITNKEPDDLLTEEESKKVIKFIEEYKNVRSICDGFIKLVKYIVPFEAINGYRTSTDMSLGTKCSFYELKLNGNWKLDKTQIFDGVIDKHLRTDIIEYGYSQYESKLVRSYLLTDSSWTLNGVQNLDGINNNYPYEIDKLEVIKYGYRQYEARMQQHPYLFTNYMWQLNGIQELDGLDNNHQYRIDNLKVIQYQNDPNLKFNNTWRLDGDQELNGKDVRHPHREI